MVLLKDWQQFQYLNCTLANHTAVIWSFHQHLYFLVHCNVLHIVNDNTFQGI